MGVKTNPPTHHVNPLSVNPIKWSNTRKEFVSKLPRNYLSVFDHSVGLAHKELTLNLSC